jgi:ABC-type uncharacterized transport system permease subunit
VTEAPTGPPLGVPPDPEDVPTFAARFAIQQRLGGVAAPIFTAVFAFLMGGLVVLSTGHDPFKTYKAIWEGAGMNWLYQFPWWHNTDTLAALALQQTLLLTTTLILTGLAVAFAFRCGMFNIGGQGQYMVGLIMANWVGVSFAGMMHGSHVLLTVLVATLAGAAWGGIAGFLKATVGAHEVIVTIMLNWIAYWIGSYVFSQGGPLQDPATPANPISADIAEGAHLPVFWGDPVLQGLHIGFFIAISMLVVFWVTLNRTTLGYEVRAVGYNPDAAAYAGISVKKNFFLAMAISGAFAGLAGGLDMTGYLYHYGTLDVQSSTIGFLGIAVALLGRNTAVGVGISALLFGALLNGTSTRGLDPNVFKPELAGHLTEMIQGLVVLFVGADVLILYVWSLRRRKFKLPRIGGEGV